MIDKDGTVATKEREREREKWKWNKSAIERIEIKKEQEAMRDVLAIQCIICYANKAHLNELN